MFLPRKIKFFFFSYLFLFLVFISGPGLAFATHDQGQSVSQVTTEQPSTVQDQELIPLPQPTDPDIQPIPKPEGDYEIREANIFSSAIKWLVGPIVNAVKTAFTTLMDFIFEIITGSSTDDFESLSYKMELYRSGGNEISKITNPGLIDYAGVVTNQALELNIPINSTQYFASLNPFAQAQAQEGARNLAKNDIILETWKRVRNVAYALAAVVLVIIGFMIMLRWKLDPRTVVTVQNSLPRIVIALILITFSFAISGFLIDITRLVTEIVMALVAVPGGHIVGFVLGVVLSIGLLTAIWGPAGLIALVLALILAIIVITVFVILIYKLLKRYVTFLLLTIFAPLFFLAGALPGGEGLILNWFKRQAAALLAIPMTALFVNLSVAIGFNGPGVTDGFPSPWPVVGPLVNILDFTLLPALVGLGIFFFATKVPDIVDEMFGIKEMGARKGIGPGAIIGAPMGAFQGVGNLGRSYRGVKTVTGMVGNVTKQSGWHPRSGTPTPDPTGMVTTAAAIPKTGFGAQLARVAARATSPLTGGSSPRPWQERKEWLGDYQRRIGKEDKETTGPRIDSHEDDD